MHDGGYKIKIGLLIIILCTMIRLKSSEILVESMVESSKIKIHMQTLEV